MTPAEAQRGKARRDGAALDALAHAVRGRAAVTPPPDPDDARPAPEDRCVHCNGWGFFEDVDGEGLDGDLVCGACDGTGIEP